MDLIGFDFGTTNSLISRIRGDGEVENFLDDQNLPVPSIVCYEGAETIVGRKAKERLSQAGLGIYGNIVRSPKMYLGDESIHIEGVERSPVDVVSDVVRYVYEHARHGGRGLDNVDGAVVTIPIDMDGIRRRRLRDAFRNANLKIWQFVHEPFAALYGFFRVAGVDEMMRRYARKPILVFDWGGGTLDLTICRPNGRSVIQILNDGTDEVGGDQFDETIMNWLIQRVEQSRGITQVIQPGAKSRLLDSCEKAKIVLSKEDSASIYLGDFFKDSADNDFYYDLQKSELEKIVGPLLDKGFRRIRKILDDADYGYEQIGLCLATGGMSKMPAVRTRLREMFGAERLQIPENSATLIAEGAAWIANDGARLSLAKNVEIVFARNSYFPIVKAGTVMPVAEEVQNDSFHLYCTDPRDGVAKFQICSPKRSGENILPGTPRANLELLTVEVDSEARAFRERLEVDISINQDLILDVHARSLNKNYEDRKQIHNLEFGLEFPDAISEKNLDDLGENEANIENAEQIVNENGGLSLRANITQRPDYTLVPGELLYEMDPGAFRSQGGDATKEQHEERLYYEPCSSCGLASNDPRCCCEELLNKR